MTKPKDIRKDLDNKGYFLSIFVALLWSGNPTSVKISLNYTTPFMVGFLRFTLGGIIALMWAIYKKDQLKIKKEHIIPIILAGLLPAAQIGFYNIGQAHTLASHGIIMIVTFPLWAAIFSHFFTPNDRLNLSRSLGIITAYTGVVVLFWDSINQNFTEYLWGDLLMLFSAMFLGGRLIWVSHITQRVGQSQVILSEAVVGSLLSLVLSLFLEKSFIDFSINLMLSMVYQGILIAGMGIILQTFLLRTYLPGKITFFNLFQPIIGVFISWFLLGESLSFMLFLSIGLLSIGTYFTIRKEV
ncbi:MAG: DMT family transporter [Chloroflexota bacterium]|nr:DMT family transporter [Chloroflexota bacterium]